ncbi:MAG: hypothetical protein V3V71_12155 [Roseateles sp.]|jgi:hypothetical protein|nr:hypothetical protein [Methylibium sp.]MBY0368752.1 hypothetical protein [Burkholderiaceae bacterium]|mmetsp:Transcript_28993/g.52409  ORF Transcript_28993/g.52409 Transcript_28993/m.52409 type:complete len:126 (-) Transcript_28993:337-714(-)
MYRCVLPLMLAASSLVAQAQTHRFFPANALRGELVITQFPDVQLNGQPARLAPGARVKNESNLWVPPAGLSGQKLTVHYTIESSGLILDVWVLNAAELDNKLWPRTPAEAASWQFNPGNQTWSKP